MPASQSAATERRNERMVSIIYPFYGCRFRRKRPTKKRWGGGEMNALGNSVPFSLDEGTNGSVEIFISYLVSNKVENCRLSGELDVFMCSN